MWPLPVLHVTGFPFKEKCGHFAGRNSGRNDEVNVRQSFPVLLLDEKLLSNRSHTIKGVM